MGISRRFSTVLAFLFVATLFADGPSQDISNGLPNPSARFHPDQVGFDVFAGLIVWTAKEVGADCWAEVIRKNGLNSSNDLREVHFGWDPGFRVGVGYGMEHDQWDTQLYYTYFYTRGTDHVSKEPGTVHSTFLGNFYVDNPLGLGLSGPAYESASIDWAIRYHIFDWEVGRHFWVSKALAVRPFVGLKGGWIHQSIHSKWKNASLLNFLLFNVGIEDIKNRFWGIGPTVGVNTKWILFAAQNHLFGLVGDFSGALMFGHWSFSDRYKNDRQQRVTVDSQNFKSGAAMIRTFLGFEWSGDFSEKRFRFSTKLGYEMQFWLDQLQFYSFTGGRLDNALTLQGGTLGFRFDF